MTAIRSAADDLALKPAEAVALAVMTAALRGKRTKARPFHIAAPTKIQGKRRRRMAGDDRG